MSLGVLNNLNAIYAENNLNNSSNSLSKVLSQLSSGSQINSGADDAAGLSLVDGLQANQMALTQSKTNATEGVGLLQVADGALSQVTSLLNRAVTLATEASNGTLNSAQDTAANQEYQSILSEISNIGSTTTYNGTAVFNKQTNIYTGDSSTSGSSINTLNIRSLSSSNVGDTAGVMAYSNGSDSVFVNLSSNTKNAQATDNLNTNGTTTINVNYLVSGANGVKTAASTTISVGSGTSFANTANGLMSAINSAGLGLSASFTTQAQAGVAGGGTQTGIQITGGVVSVGVDPNATSTSGTLNLTGSGATNLLTQGQTIAIQSGTQTAISIAVTSNIQTLSDLATAINGASAANSSNGGTQVVATVVTNSTGVQSLSLTDQSAGEGTLTVTPSAGISTPAISATAATGNPVNLSFVVGSTGTAPTAPGSSTPGTYGTATLGITGIGTNAAAAPLSGSIVLANTTVGGVASSITINMNTNGSGSNATTINLTTAQSTLTGLAGVLNGTTIIDAGATSAVTALNVTASVTNAGLSLTANSFDTSITGNSANLTAIPGLALSNVVGGASAYAGTQGTTVLAMTGGPGLSAGDALTPFGAGTGTITVTNSTIDTPGTTVSFIIGAGTNDTTHFYTQNDIVNAGGNTVQNLVDIMGTGLGAAAAGLSSAALSGPDGNILLTSNTVGTTITATSNVVDPQAMANGAVTPGQAQNLVGSSSAGASFTMAAMVAPDANNDPMTTTGDTLAGSIVLSNGNPGTNLTIAMGGGGGADSVAGQVITLNNAHSNLTGLMNAINGVNVVPGVTTQLSALNITAAMGANDNGLTFTTAATGTKIAVNTTNLTDASTFNFTNPVSGGAGTYASGTVALVDGGKLLGAGDATSGVFSGSIVVTNGAVTDTFKMGAGASVIGGNTNTIFTGAATLTSLITAINTEGGGTPLGNTLALTATRDASTGGIFLQGTATGNTGLLATSSLTDTITNVKTDGSQGAAIVASNVGASVTFGSGAYNLAGDTVTGNLVIKNSGGTNATTTFVMGGAANIGAENSTLGATTVNVFGTTLQALANAVNADSTGAFAGVAGVDLSATIGASGLTVSAMNTVGGLGVISGTGASTLTDQYGTNELTPNAGAPATGATYASAVLGASGVIGGSDALSGSIVLNNGGANFTFTMDSTSANTVGNNIHTNGYTLGNLATAITNSGMGINATYNSSTGQIQMQSTNLATTIAVTGTNTLHDNSAAETFAGGASTEGTPQSAGTPGAPSQATVILQNMGTNAAAGNVLTGSIVLTGATTQTFTMGGQGMTTLQNLADAITNNATLGITASVTTTGLALAAKTNNTTPLAVGNNTLADTLGGTEATSTLSGFRSVSDTLSNGTISFTMNSVQEAISINSGQTVQNLVDKINTGALGNQVDPYGIHASYANGSITMTSDTYGTNGNFVAPTTNIADTMTGVGLSYTANSAYNVGISNSTGANALFDSSTQSAPIGDSKAYSNFTSSTGGASGIATISYSDGAGVSLSATDLSNQTDAQGALTNLNSAITAVAAQDGYIGAQINTLNAVSQVLSTQQENVQAAQNAVQATDYASATSNMSKYEILSQTGIAALAQANSIQQEVTKLLQ